jgi:hypothetical protein
MEALLLAALLAAAPYADDLSTVREARAAATAETAEQVFLDELRGRLIPRWLGTPWDFYGTTQSPGEGEIACGYFVTTLLRDMGVKLERVKLAQLASEHIVTSLTPARRIKRFSRKKPTDVVRWVEAQGDGVYVVGLDHHVGFLVHRAGRTEMCHSSNLPPVRVVCEDAKTSDAMVSGYHVVGEVTNPWLMKRWLAGKRIQTR